MTQKEFVIALQETRDHNEDSRKKENIKSTKEVC